MTEVLTIDPTMGEGRCGMCRREIGEGEQRLRLGLLSGDAEVEVELCRPCISEHAPVLLETVEAGDVSIDGGPIGGDS